MADILAYGDKSFHRSSCNGLNYNSMERCELYSIIGETKHHLFRRKCRLCTYSIYDVTYGHPLWHSCEVVCWHS